MNKFYVFKMGKIKKPEQVEGHPKYQSPEDITNIITKMVITPPKSMFAYMIRKKKEAKLAGFNEKHMQYIVSDILALIGGNTWEKDYDPNKKNKYGRTTTWNTYVYNRVIYAIYTEHKNRTRKNKRDQKLAQKSAKLSIQCRNQRSAPGPASEQGDFVLESYINELDSIEDAVYWKEIKAYISDYLDPPNDSKREVQVEKGLIFSMRVDGYSNKEIADILGRTPEYLRLYFTRKRKGLLKYLKKVGLSEEDMPYDMIIKIKNILGETK